MPTGGPKPDPTRRRRYHHGDLPAALLQACAEAIVEVGVSQVSMRDVARRAGVSHGAPAHHFADKAGLLQSLALDGFNRLDRALVEARDAAGPEPAARFAATGRAYVLFAAAHPAHFQVMYRPELRRRPSAALVAAIAGVQTLQHAIVAEAQRAGYARDADPRALGLSAWATAHGLAKLWLEGDLLGSSGFPDLPTALDAVFGAAG